MENKNGQGIFYGVIGVATLIVAIIGATFAYFSAAGANNSTTITGTTGQGGGLTLTVTKVSDGNGPLIPQLDETIGDAIVGTDNESCVDAKGNTVCHVYSIKVENSGSSAVSVPGTLGIVSPSTNIKWQRIESATTLGSGLSSGTAAATLTPSSFATAALEPAGDTANNDEITYYVVVWLHETGNPQASDENKSFTGTVSFELASGTGVTSTFTVSP